MVLNIYGDAKDIKIMDDEITSIKKKYNSYYEKYNNLNKILLNEDYYDDNENYVVQEYNWPDDTELTSSLYKGKSCKTNGVYNKVYYKPNNQQYGVQGAVDSSSRVTRLKYNTMQKAGKFMGDKSNTKPFCIKTKC